MAGPDNFQLELEGISPEETGPIHGVSNAQTTSRRLTSPPPPYTFRDHLDVQGLLAKLDDVQAQLEQHAYLLAILEINIDKHVKFAVREEVISRLWFSSILAAGLGLVIARWTWGTGAD
ncbi:hypothetical protein B0H13DRAFT_2301523 [Mycena leptocephala]|nr:hypothetical protein B0H13DRAFT_2301523 [Mycena leptocephala]